MTSRSETFARRLASLRESAGLSVPELAERAGLTRQFLWRLERGDKEPSLETARRLAVALGKGLECWD